jgi:F-type H+-transporting ATPase subunit gamma
MPSLVDIRRRIRSVKNTQQITKAMKMVSAAKLRRAQDRVIASRPYAAMLERMLKNLAAAAASTESEEIANHPMLQARPENRILILVVTGDRGLAGAFNSNVIRTVQHFIADRPKAQVTLELMGRRGRDFFRRRHANIGGEYTTLFMRTVEHDQALEIARSVADRFAKEEFDAVYVVANYFRNVVASDLVTRRILPIELPKSAEVATDYIYAQPPEELLKTLLPRYIDLEVYRTMLESSAAEQAARMTAMDAASTNAAEVIDKLTLNMNRVRQASITREIIEIVSGAAALE